MDGLNIELKDYNKLSFSFDSNVKPIYLCFNIHKVSKPIVSISNTCNDKFVYSDLTKHILGHKRGLSYNLDISCDTKEIINVMSNYLLDDYKVQLILPYVQGIRAENSLGFNAYYQENLLQTSKYLDNSNLITIDITNEIAKQIDNYKKGFSIYDLKISIESIKDINLLFMTIILNYTDF